jgi:hypothetical protein
VFVLVVVRSAYAADLTVPHIFSPGTTAKSSEVNENFATIYNAVSSLQAQRIEIGSVVRSYADHPEGSWPLGDVNASPQIPFIGTRIYSVPIRFQNSFVFPPNVTVSLSHLDSKNSIHSTRVSVYAENITSTGFNIKMQSWVDSVVYGVGVQWIAVSM